MTRLFFLEHFACSCLSFFLSHHLVLLTLILTVIDNYVITYVLTKVNLNILFKY